MSAGLKIGKRAIGLVSSLLGCGIILPAQDAVRRTFPRPNFELRTWDAPSALAGGGVRSIVQADDGCIWILTVRDLIRYDGYEFKTLPKPRNIEKDPTVDGLWKDANGRLWLTTPDGAIPIDEIWPNPSSGEIPVSFPPPRAPDEKIRLLAPQDFKNLLPGGIELPLDPAIGGVTTAVQDMKDDLWLGTETGLFRSIGCGKAKSVEPFLTGDAVEALLADREGVLWIGTKNSGLAMLRRTTFTNATFSGNGFDNNFRSVFVDGRGRAWVGTLNGKLLRFQSGRLTEAPLDRDVFDDFMFTMAEDAEGNLLLGTEKRGLYRWRRGRLDRIPIRQDSDEGAIVSLFTDSRRRIWLSRLGEEFGYLEGGRFRRFLSKEDGYVHKMIFNVFEDSRHNLWLGHVDGLALLEDGLAEKSRMKSFLKNVSVSSIHEDRDGILWLGTYGHGLVRFDPRTGESFFYSGKYGLGSPSIHRILEDDSGRFWIASLDGVLLVDPSELNAVAEGRSDRFSVVAFGTEDGLLNESCSIEHRNSAARLPDGSLIFATEYGLAIVDPGHVELNAVPPTVSIENVAVDGRPCPAFLAPDTVASMGARRRLDIGFRAFSSLGSGRIRYKYRLSGIDAGWIDLAPGAERKVSYSGLVAGRHVFQVAAANGHGAWNEDGASMSFIVRRPLVQTGLFRIGALLAAAGAAAALILRRQRSRRKKGDKYSRTRLPEDKADVYRDRLIELLVRDKIYRDPSISIGVLAGRLSIPAHHLSQVINDKMGKRFFDLINGYRIEEAKTRLANGNVEKQKILAVALDVGFGSLGSFNRAFKRYTGTTPTEFRNRHQV
jgi:AraC-like DNA-binding protein/streptogramin lyase